MRRRISWAGRPRRRRGWKERRGRRDASCRTRPHYPSFAGTLARSASQALALPSEGARQSPRGESEPPEPTLGAFGATLRLNWLRKNRVRNPSSHFLIAGSLYFPFHACIARKATLLGAYPKRRM